MQSGKIKVQHIDILNANDEELQKISIEGVLSLNLEEMRTIKDYFVQIGRNPTDVELETLAQTWSEHCVHKTFKGIIEYTEIENGKEKSEIINRLLHTYLIRATRELNKEWCLSVFSDNAGIIAFDENYGVAFKVETHNHPSAIEPYGGSETGIGGVIRDTLGVGLGAKPIMNTDVFCFGPHDLPYDELPKGTLHPRRIFKGVVAGVRDYGNRMGIPTCNGAILFDRRYIGNPLVYCGNVGLIPRDKCYKKVSPGDLVVVVGGRTGRDGIHGATFSSIELTDDSEVTSSSAVQIGNAIVEKKMTDTILQARDKGLYNAITDCGAGGLSSAVGEMGKDTGATVYLEKVPLKYSGLAPWEIWVSEAQERMVLAVPPEKIDELLKVFADEDVEATVIGEFTNNKKLHLLYDGETVADIDMEFVHDGIPKARKQAIWKLPVYEEPTSDDPSDLTLYLLDILSSPNVASKEWVIRQYDHEVQGGSIIKPLQGIDNDGPGDACIIRPLLNSKRGVVVSNGINPKYSDIDTYWMAGSAIDEALRNIVSVGGNLKETAILDNFSWGNPDKPDRLGTLVRAIKACYDFAIAYGTPFISGKDSLNNEYRDSTTGETLSIPPTLLISAISVIDDISKAITMDVKSPSDLIYAVGRTYDELGASHYYSIRGFIGNNVPKVRPIEGKRSMEKLSKAISRGLVKACHDCSEGGIGVAIAEMAFSGGYGMEIHLKNVPCSDDVIRNDTILFSESNSRFIVEVSKEDQTEFEKVMSETDVAVIGEVTDNDKLIIYGLNENVVVSVNIYDLKNAWQKTFRW
ncbi:TPA: phosphoribosylformylglycinamidine synthase subunit PurL [Candidatus Poribacteria bacterium]|nr:phosphoribosylformylglycinamidine synthase subunit PurL [Candidatus Poribacteria bacterium]